MKLQVIALFSQVSYLVFPTNPILLLQKTIFTFKIGYVYLYTPINMAMKFDIISISHSATHPTVNVSLAISTVLGVRCTGGWDEELFESAGEAAVLSRQEAHRAPTVKVV